MEKTLIRQNPQWSNIDFKDLCNRDIMANLLKKKNLRHVQILTGVRRCGKSTIFKLLINDLLATGIEGKEILVLNLDDPQFIPFWDSSSKLFSVIENAEKLTGIKVKYLFLDEVQHIQDWELFVKSVYDSNLFTKIYITGSNSNLLQNRFSALLSGRYFENEVRPFSLSEVLRAKGFSTLLDCYHNTPDVLRIVDSVLLYGSFPEIVLSDVDENIKLELLKSYFDSIVQKDCIIYNNIRDTYLFYRLVNYLLQYVGNRFSIPTVAKALKSNENTILTYLNYLCDSYICSDVRNFSYSLKETNRSQHKCYCIDNGLIVANVFRYSPQSGNALENLVYNELKNKGYENISFDNSKTECDFIAYKDGEAHCFQVCYELNEMNRMRELKGFVTDVVSLKSKTLITYNQKDICDDIKVVPIWEWVISGS
ncbi:ATP-binding protein [Butyricimonas hominis]|jgi:ATP-binding protein|uniref:ATP-binding protein n=1 Tax=Butyricimonas hominis TaxID=2763032 RepID=A0ABR7CY43_9BACT|nr:ATP-binding protein [Butyricimonas hominis]MBC5620442.1 ATP-binding protein [Butyricimonas hominis]